MTLMAFCRADDSNWVMVCLTLDHKDARPVRRAFIMNTSSKTGALPDIERVVGNLYRGLKAKYPLKFFYPPVSLAFYPISLAKTEAHFLLS